MADTSSTPERCPTCGTFVEVVGGDEGTMSYRPAADNAADALAGGIRSFLSSLPYAAPEAIGYQARVKLAGPLAEYERNGTPAS